MRREPDLSSGDPSYRLRWLLAWVLVLAGGIAPVRAQVDTAINQTVWKMLYGVTDAQINDPLWLAADDDGDGLSNGAELAAGTNPFDPASSLAVSSLTSNAGALTLTFPTVFGKQYVLQSTTNLADPTTWSTLSPAVQAAGTSTPQTLLAPAPVPAADGSVAPCFYRVMVQDVDTDGDGVSDWAEKITGFDPTTAYTHGATQDDHTALTADLALENVVTVTATKATATAPPDALTAATDTASLTITRGGTLHFSAITVPLNWSGTAVAGLDYAALPAFVTFPPKVGSITLTVLPLANPARQTAATITLSAMPGGGYTVGAAHSASAAIAPAGVPGGTGLTGTYYNGNYKTVTPYNPAALFAGTPALQRLDPTVDFLWSTGNVSGPPGAGVNATYFGVRWQGQVQPQYSETYYFVLNGDDGFKLWVNGQLVIDNWAFVYGDHTGSIALQAGVLYDIRLEYFQVAGADSVHLSWYSNSQTKQIVPTARLYPLTSTPAPPAITSAPTATGFVNQPFAFDVTASTSGGAAATFALGVGSGPLPPGLALDPVTGLITGTPTVAGDYQVALTAANAYGAGASVLDIQILNPGSGVTRELWQNVADASLSSLPLTTAPDSTDTTLTTLEDNNTYPANTGERLRGYFTAPATGNYYFWLAASGAAEFDLSDDAGSVSLVRRAWVTAPGTGVESWNDPGQTHQRTPWLALTAGQRYYYEVLFNSGAGGPGNLAVGWLQDNTGTAASPTANAGGIGGGVVTGYVLYAYDYPTTTAAAGTLYVTNLSPQGVAVSAATGSANLRMLPGNTQAVLHFNYGGLSSPRTAYHIHIAPDNTGSGPIVFDLDDVDKFHPELKTADGGYIWNITDSGAYTAAQIVSAVQNGTTYFNVHTVNYPAGEIRGFLTLVNGSQTAPTPVADPGYTDDSASVAGAARFLNQASFGADPGDLAAVQAGGFAAWISAQQALPATHLLPDVLAQGALLPTTPYPSSSTDNAWWRAAVTAPDQLRQRVAFALSEILVVSDNNGVLAARGDCLASYYDALSDHAFGNFRDLLDAVTLHPAMGIWLNVQGNALGNLATGHHPNENYAREVLQLFSVGLNRLWPDGSLVLDAAGNLVPTYTQDAITNGFARSFTGWTWHQALQGSGQFPTSFYPAADYLDPMVMVKGYHELGPKNLLDHVVLPAAVGYTLGSAPFPGSQADTTTAAYDSYGTGDLESSLDNIFNHPNVGPYVCRQLIQRLVESNPSPAYIYRVVQKFNDDGTSAHVRGNLAAVVSAILLDGEARDTATAAASATAGKQREPLLRLTGPARTFPFQANSGQYGQSGGAVMTITTNRPHRLSGSDVIGLDFTVNDTGNPPAAPPGNPSTGSYPVLTFPAPTATTFSVLAANFTNAQYSLPAGTNTMTISMAGPAAGESIYLEFPTAIAANRLYTVASNPSPGSFTVTTTEPAPAKTLTGWMYVPRVAGAYAVSAATPPAASTITLSTNVSSNVSVGDHLWLAPTSADQVAAGEFVVASIVDERHFTVANSLSLNAESNISFSFYPVNTLPPTRSGNVALPASKFDMQNTNTQIAQTPLDSATVFNFFAPDYRYPGSLASNNVTTPEFELTTDSNVVTLTNTIAATILASNNTAGLSSFKGGAINLDLGAYMTAPYATAATTTTSATSGNRVTATTTVTTTVDANLLVNTLGDVLAGGGLSAATKATLVNFISDPVAFPTTVSASATGTVASPPAAPAAPAANSARDKVRAVVQAILVSPEYAIQR